MTASCAAHIQQSSRVELGKKFESGFYAKPDTHSPQAVSAGEPTISMTALLELLKDADPEMTAKLDWLLWNKPLEYAQMVLRGEMEHYLSLGCDQGRLED